MTFYLPSRETLVKAILEREREQREVKFNIISNIRLLSNIRCVIFNEF